MRLQRCSIAALESAGHVKQPPDLWGEKLMETCGKITILVPGTWYKVLLYTWYLISLGRYDFGDTSKLSIRCPNTTAAQRVQSVLTGAEDISPESWSRRRKDTRCYVHKGINSAPYIRTSHGLPEYFIFRVQKKNLATCVKCVSFFKLIFYNLRGRWKNTSVARICYI